MAHKEYSKGFSPLAVIAAIFAIAVICVGGWYIWRQHNGDGNNASSAGVSSSRTGTRTVRQGSSEDGKYLVIREWGIRAALPDDLAGMVTYTLGPPTTDPDGNRIQAAKVTIKSTAFSATACAIAGGAVESGAQYIRSEAGKPFNTSRYRQTIKANILKDTAYDYHLNYVTPDCLGGGTNAAKVQALQATLAAPTKVE